MCIRKRLERKREQEEIRRKLHEQWLEDVQKDKEERERKEKEYLERLRARRPHKTQTQTNNGRVDETKYLVAISKALPLEPQSDEVIFVEPEANPWLETFIEENYDDIVDMFRSRNLRFVYMPRMIQGLSQELLDYNYPGMSFQRSSLTDAEVLKRFYLPFFDNALSPMPRTPLLLRFKRFNTIGKEFLGENPGPDVGEFHVFSHFSLPTEPFRRPPLATVFGEEGVKALNAPTALEEDNDEMVFILRDYLSNVGENIFFSRSMPEEEESTLTAEEKRLIDEINERVKKLRSNGVSEMLIKSLFDVPKVQPSHLRISNDFRFYLTDYGNREVKMSVLPKVLYLFYLKHPEGVTFKDLAQHKRELMDYYKQISNRVDLQKMELSIKNLGDSDSNSVYEKCSLIRAAFLREFDESVVGDFLVRELDKHKRAVNVSRDLIVDETGLL